MDVRPKKVWKPIDGVLLLDKPLGLSSNDALQKARRLFSAAKGGHTGTLDPLATGLLPLCFGEATKFSADLLDADKTYEATLRLGIETDSGDAEGKILAIHPVAITTDQLAAVLTRFVGPISQIPPMYSALKRDGRPLYELARQGVVVERAARAVTIHAIENLGWVGDELRLRVACSKGTYIRVLAADIGAALGCGAHLIALRRTQVGNLVLDHSPTLDELASLDEAVRLDRLLPVDALLVTLPRVDLQRAAQDRFLHGNPVSNEVGVPGKIRVYGEGRLLGVGEGRVGDGLIWPKRLVQQTM